PARSAELMDQQILERLDQIYVHVLSDKEKTFENLSDIVDELHELKENKSFKQGNGRYARRYDAIQEAIVLHPAYATLSHPRFVHMAKALKLLRRIAPAAESPAQLNMLRAEADMLVREAVQGKFITEVRGQKLIQGATMIHDLGGPVAQAHMDI